jgi:hypothetical protein
VRGLPWFGVATRRRMQRMPGKGLSLVRQRSADFGSTAKSAAMATPSPGAEPSAFPLIVRPLPAAMSKQSTKPIPRDLATAFCEAVLSYQDWAPGNAEPTVVFCGHVEPISAICAMVESFKSDQIPGDIFLRLCAYVRVGDEYLKIDLASDRCYSKAADCLLQLIQRRVTEYVRQEAWRRDRA